MTAKNINPTKKEIEYNIIFPKINLSGITVEILTHKSSQINYVFLRPYRGGYTLKLTETEARDLIKISENKNINDLKKFTTPADKRKKQIRVYPTLKISDDMPTYIQYGEDEHIRIKKFSSNKWFGIRMTESQFFKFTHELGDIIKQFIPYNKNE